MLQHLLHVYFSPLIVFSTHTLSLEERKEQWRREAEERRKNAPDPTIPSGHTMMSESERQETLKSLKESMSVYVSLTLHLL